MNLILNFDWTEMNTPKYTSIRDIGINLILLGTLQNRYCNLIMVIDLSPLKNADIYP